MINEAERAVSGISTALSGLGTAWSFASQAVDVIFGLPIQVVLACFFASAAARTRSGQAGLWTTAWMITTCAVLGAYSVPLVLHLLGLPTTVQAGVGVLISGGIQLPAVREWMIDIVKALVQRKVGAPAPAAPTVPPAAPAGSTQKEPTK